jgi:hypothetical protein
LLPERGGFLPSPCYGVHEISGQTKDKPGRAHVTLRCLCGMYEEDGFTHGHFPIFSIQSRRDRFVERSFNNRLHIQAAARSSFRISGLATLELSFDRWTTLANLVIAWCTFIVGARRRYRGLNDRLWELAFLFILGH